MNSSVRQFFLLSVLCGKDLVQAFQPNSYSNGCSSNCRSRYRHMSTHLRVGDISEWRDLMFEPPSDIQVENDEEGPLREVCIMPFPLNDALLQGETKELCLYEERFHELFEKSKRDHAGVVAMGLMAPPSGILQNMPLCEIESVQTMQGDTGFGTFSILATIRVVGRASLIYVGDEGNQYLTGWCTELGDNTSSNDERNSKGKDIIQTGNDIADKLESVFDSIIELEEKLSSVRDKVSKRDDEVSEAALRRMKIEEELGLSDEDDDEDEDEDIEIDDDSLRSLFEKALQTAKSSDTQGYRIVSTDSSTKTESGNELRSVQELTALSWAYLSQELFNPDDILSYRLRAIELEDVCGRLKLALVMMMEHRSKLRETLKSKDE